MNQLTPDMITEIINRHYQPLFADLSKEFTAHVHDLLLQLDDIHRRLTRLELAHSHEHAPRTDQS